MVRGLLVDVADLLLVLALDAAAHQVHHAAAAEEVLSGVVDMGIWLQFH